MTPARSRRRSGERGQSTVEFALVLLPFLLLVMGAFDLGRAVFYAHMLSNAAREGARVGVVAGRTPAEICARAKASLLLPDVPVSAGCDVAGSLTVAVPQRGTAGSATDPVRVTLSYTFQPVTPLIAQIVGNAFTLRASSTMYVEN